MSSRRHGEPGERNASGDHDEPGEHGNLGVAGNLGAPTVPMTRSGRGGGFVRGGAIMFCGGLGLGAWWGMGGTHAPLPAAAIAPCEVALSRETMSVPAERAGLSGLSPRRIAVLRPILTPETAPEPEPTLPGEAVARDGASGTTYPAVPFRLPVPRLELPAEFESQAAIVLGCGEMVECYPEMLGEIVRRLRDRVDLLALVPHEACRKKVEHVLAAYGLPADAVEFATVPHNTMWTRDYGPFIVRQPNGTAALTDTIYVGADRDKDDLVPWWLGRSLSLPVVHVPLTLEGGNLLSNGRGLLLTTRKVFAKNAERGIDEAEVLRLLDQFYGARETVVLEPLQGESTGHVDMFAVFTAPRTVLVGQYDPALDPINAAILDRNAERLRRTLFDGLPLEVLRMPMPAAADGKYRTYTNAVFANGVLLVPQYGTRDPDGLALALDLYRRCLPGWRIETVDATKVIEMGGALHCMTLNLAEVRPVPALRAAAWPLPVKRSSRRS